MMFDLVLETLATIAGLVGSFAIIPQVYRIFRRKSAKDLSISTYSVFFIAGVIWVLYGLDTQSFPIWTTNLIGSLALLGIIVGWILYGRE